MSHKAKLKPLSNRSRCDVTMSRLGCPETKLAVLLEQASGISEELAMNQRSTQGSSQVKAVSQELLENHILIIAHIVKQLSQHMKAMEGHISQHDLAISGTSVAVQNLDQKTLAAVADLRGRVARCDGCISALGIDVSAGERRLIRLQREAAELRSAVDAKFNEMTEKLHRTLGRLEASLLHHFKMKITSDFQKQEDRIYMKLNESLEHTNSLKKWTEEELNSLAQLCTHQQEKTVTQLLQTEAKLSDQLHALEARVEQHGTRVDQANQLHADMIKHCETKLSKRMDLVEGSLLQELQLFKHECDRGFEFVRDAIESLRQIGETRSLFDKRRLQKDIKDIRSRIAKPTDL